MIRKTLLAAAAIVIIVVALGAYLGMPQVSADQAMRLPVDPAPLTIETAGGERSFTIEVADDQSERSQGLMFRETMDDDHGMLFVFEQSRPVGFWMKNTPMPLDLVFIGQDGRITGVLPGEPFSEALIASGLPVRFVLELKRGTAERLGIGDGNLVRHPAIVKSANSGDAG
jgi:uncharacterized membrane protein (UPF0127 family)